MTGVRGRVASRDGRVPVRRVPAFWCRIPSRANVGDALTPWLVQRLTGRYPRFVPPGRAEPTHLVSGSIAVLAGRSTTVWGAGVMHAGERLSPEANWLAVRGPLTAARVRAAGAPAPQALGDPAMVLPRLHAPAAAPPAGVGLALHFSDRARLAPLPLPDGVRLIDMQWRVETVIAAVRACELVASSSLHGIVIAHAYGIPATWVEFRPLPSGDGSKFRDHLRCVGSDRDEPLRVRPDRLDVAALWAHAVPPPDAFDAGALWESCPFTRWAAA